jgi:hypothetical protein
MKQLREKPIKQYFGMNTSKSPNEINQYEAEEVTNFLIRDPSRLKRRKGLTLLKADAGEYRILGLSHIGRGSNKTHIRTVNTTIQKLGASSWDTLTDGTGLTANKDMNYVSIGSYLYGFNGTDAVRKISTTAVASVVGIPIGKFGCYWRNYLFTAGVAAYKNRLYFSDLGDVETFGANNYIDIEPDDKDEITGIIQLKDKIVITKHDSCHYLVGAGTDTFAIYPITYEFGIESHRSLASVGNDVWGISRDGTVRSIFRNQYGLLDGKDMSSNWLKGTTDSLNRSALEVSCGAIVDGNYVLAVPTGSSTYNDKVLVYDFYSPIAERYSKWVQFDGWTPSCFDVDGVDLFIGEAQAKSLVYRWIGDTDNGTDIEATWISPEHTMDSLGTRKRFRQLWVWTYPIGDYSGKAYYRLDKGSWTELGDLSFLSDGALWGEGVWGTFIWGAIGEIKNKYHYGNSGNIVGRTIQIKFVYNDDTEPIEIGQYSIYFTDLRFRQ